MKRSIRFLYRLGMFLTIISMEAPSYCWSKEHSQPMNQYMTKPSFWLFRYRFWRWTFTRVWNIHLFLSWDTGWLFHQWDQESSLTSRNLAETVDIWMVPISLVYAGLTGFQFQWFAVSCRSSLKDPRMEVYGDDLAAFSVSHAQVSPDSWRSFELCLCLYFDLRWYQFYSGQKDTNWKVSGLAHFASFDLLL